MKKYDVIKVSYPELRTEILRQAVKKEITNLLQQEEITIKLNDFSNLHRWTKDGMGNDVDKLTITFQMHNIGKTQRTYEVKSRDVAGIHSEIIEYTSQWFDTIKSEITTAMKGGYYIF